MPLIETANALASQRRAAKNVVKAQWRARFEASGVPFTEAEIEQMQDEIEQADSLAIATWFVASNLVTVAVTGAAGTGKAT